MCEAVDKWLSRRVRSLIAMELKCDYKLHSYKDIYGHRAPLLWRVTQERYPPAGT